MWPVMVGHVTGQLEDYVDCEYRVIILLWNNKHETLNALKYSIGKTICPNITLLPPPPHQYHSPTTPTPAIPLSYHPSNTTLLPPPAIPLSYHPSNTTLLPTWWFDQFWSSSPCTQTKCRWTYWVGSDPFHPHPYLPLPTICCYTTTRSGTVASTPKPDGWTWV